MQVSVAIIAFNEADYLREAIESVLAQTFQPIEIIVVDDGSTDHTRAVCESFGPRVSYFYQENDGTMGSTARVLSITKAKTDWVALLDQDDLWLPEKLEKQVAAATEFPDVAAVFTRYQGIDGAGQPLSGPLDPQTGKALYLSSAEAYHHFLRSNPFCPSSVLLNRNVFDRCAFPDVNNPGCGDWDTWLRIATHFSIAVIDERLTKYRVHQGHFCTNKHRLASRLKLTLARQKGKLHPGCEQCQTAYGAGKRHVAHVFAVAARDYLDEYFAAARAGAIPSALPFLRGALQASPCEVLKPRRFFAVIKNLLLAPTRRARRVGVQR